MSETQSLLGEASIVPVINFNEIPPAGQLLVPGDYVEIAADYDNIGLLPFPARILVIGQFGTGPSATSGQVYNIYRQDQPGNLFGDNSMLADALAYVFKTNPLIPIDAIGLMNTGGFTAAAGSITFGGAAQYADTQAIGLVGNRVTFTINPGDSPATMATNFIAAVEALPNAANIPVNLATNSTAGQVTLTAAFHGQNGNYLDCRANPAWRDQTVPGVTIAVVPIGNASGGTPGTGVPDIAAALSAIATTWYTDIILCFGDNTSLTEAIAAAVQRYTAMINVDSHFYAAITGSQGQISAAIGPTAGVNCPFLSVMGITNPQDPPWRWAASIGAVAAQALLADPARQLRTLVLPGIIPPAPADRIYETEQNFLLQDGVATYDAASDGTTRINRLVTTYTESPLGVLDPTYRDIMTPKVMTRIRYDWRNYLKLRWPKAKLAPDGSVAAEYDPTIATPSRVQGSWASRCQLYERAGWIVNAEETVQQSVFYIDPNDPNRLNSQRKLQIIGNLMVDAEQLLFSIN